MSKDDEIKEKTEEHQSTMQKPANGHKQIAEIEHKPEQQNSEEKQITFWTGP